MTIFLWNELIFGEQIFCYTPALVSNFPPPLALPLFMKESFQEKSNFMFLPNDGPI